MKTLWLMINYHSEATDIDQSIDCLGLPGSNRPTLNTHLQGILGAYLQNCIVLNFIISSS